MHDVHRDSLIAKGKKRKVKKTDHAHSHDEHADSHGDDHGHTHGEKNQGVHSQTGHSHGDDTRHHDHENDHSDIHVHDHEHESFEDRAFAHVHEHGHNFYHVHHHTHHPEHVSITHKIFRDPVRDWFGAALMGLLIVVGYLKLLPGHLSDGMLVCAAVIGIFPALKNALFDCIYKREFRFELLVGVLLLAGLFLGRFFGIGVNYLLG